MQLVIAAAGSSIGGALLGTEVVALGLTGNAIGLIAAQSLASMFAPTQKGQGPRLGDLRVGGSSYGAVAPWVAGTPRLAGQIVWASDKRELATTVEQGGKGGGGSEYTTYSYEVDLLLLLTENSYPGVIRVWRNGELVYNVGPTASNDTETASNATPAWTSITYYDGNPTQQPDPIYEAAVTTALAPAYRGRGTVMIEGLQLGSSGQIPNLTFEMTNGYPGDHPPGDGLTRLQCLFAGGSTADVSQYLEGNATNVNNGYVTVADGYCKILMGNGQNYLAWSSNNLGRNPNTGHTIEGFFKVEENHVNPSSSMEAVVVDMLNMALSQLKINGYSGGVNAMNLTAVTWYSYTDTGVDAFSSRLSDYTHIAWVCDDSSNGDLRVYVDGTLLVTYNTGPLTKTAPYSGGITIGTDDTGVTQTAWVYCSGVRIRRAEMYTGSSFSPPGSPADWGEP